MDHNEQNWIKHIIEWIVSVLKAKWKLSDDAINW